MPRYNPATIEPKWQKFWEENATFAAPRLPTGEKRYVLDMFPYPSGEGLHVGHPEGYTATDIVCRYQRMRGRSVMHPMGWDAFGLPAEQHAKKTCMNHRNTTERNIATFRRQLKMIGFSYDWSREVATTDTAYFRWTQAIFLILFDTWYDAEQQRGRPIAELPIPEEVTAESEDAVRCYQDDHRLAYQLDALVNWCPALGTVLANEEVTNEGRSDRGNHPVYRRPLRQWMLRITAYADRLERDLELVDWPEAIRLMQGNWIGRSEGAEVDFAVEDSEEVIRVYTTRPDTLFGATYMVLAPEHELVDVVTSDEQRAAVQAYVEQARHRSDLDRTAETKEKTGVFTGGYAINPVNDERIPIWIADYVLMGYGTGAIMAVPAHDTRDYEFALKYNLPIVQVVQPPGNEDWRGYVGDGIAVNSGRFDGLTTAEFKKQITEWLESESLGKGAVNYKLRDWLFSRQRYWGEPFPILHDAATGQVFALDESELPVELPTIEDYRPQASDDPNAPPAPPLGRATDWANVRGYMTEAGSVKLVRPGQDAPAGVPVRAFRRELNTMPQWAGSCWYYLRYLDKHNDDALVAPEVEDYWMAPCDGGPVGGGVDLYVGGAEHAVLHLLYARFWHKVLYDLGYVSSPEPFGRLFNQGYIQAYAYQDARGMYVDVNDIEEQGEGKDLRFIRKSTGEPVTRSLGKMGKSLKNAVAPDDICHNYGTDTLRAYEMYMGPLEASKPWSTRDIVGMSRFLQAVWRRFVAEDGSIMVVEEAPDDRLHRLLHKTVKRVTFDMHNLRFNTAIAALIELNNALSGGAVPRQVAETFLKLLAPIAPHLCEELWQRLRGSHWHRSISVERWPAYDEALCVEAEVEIVVQVMGKIKARITLPASADEGQMREVALADERIVAELTGKTVRKVVCIPGRLVNIVAN